MVKKRKIYVWCQKWVDGYPVWFIACYVPPETYSKSFMVPYVCVHFHPAQGNISHHSGNDAERSELLAAALEFRRCYRECLNT